MEVKVKKKKRPLLKRVWFWLLIIFVGLPITIGVIAGITSSDESPEEVVEKGVKVEPPPEEPKEQSVVKEESPPKEGASSNDGVLPAYQVVEIEDVSFGSVKRYGVRVRVDSVLTSSELELVSRRIIEELEVTKPHNALMIFYYLPDSDTDAPYTAGKAVWAPDGDWGKADESPTGNYSKHQLSLSPGNATGIDAEEVKVPGFSLEERKKIFFDLVAAQDRGVGDVEAYGIIAAQYNVDGATVRKIAVEGASQGWPMP